MGLRRACHLLKELLQVHQAREALAELGAAYCKGKWQGPDIPVLGAELCLGKNDLNTYDPGLRSYSPQPWWGTFVSMRGGSFFHHKIHTKHQDLAQRDGRYDMVMLTTRKLDE